MKSQNCKEPKLPFSRADHSRNHHTDIQVGIYPKQTINTTTNKLRYFNEPGTGIQNAHP